MLYKIYTLSDNTGKDIFYVGHTRNSVLTRLMQHLKEAYSSNSKAAKIRCLNYEVLITVIEVVESKDIKIVESVETGWIHFYQEKGYTLTNTHLTKKSEEVVGYSFSSKGLKCYNKLSNKLKKVV